MTHYKTTTVRPIRVTPQPDHPRPDPDPRRWIALVLLPALIILLNLAGTYLANGDFRSIKEALRILAGLGGAYGLGIITMALRGEL